MKNTVGALLLASIGMLSLVIIDDLFHLNLDIKLVFIVAIFTSLVKIGLDVDDIKHGRT